MDKETWDNLLDFDEKHVCPACSYDDLANGSIKVTYKRYINGPDLSYMERECTRCGHKWQEKPTYLTIT